MSIDRLVSMFRNFIRISDVYNSLSPSHKKEMAKEYDDAKNALNAHMKDYILTVTREAIKETKPFQKKVDYLDGKK